MEMDGNRDQSKYHIPLEGKIVSLERGYLFPAENLSLAKEILFP